MAEIKSAIELAMERTKNLVMDEGEKRELARKDFEDRMRAIVRRFLEGMIDERRFLADVGDVKGDTREKRLLLADLIIQGFETAIDNERLFELLQVVSDDSGHGLGDEAKALKAGFVRELDGRKAGIREEVVARLRKMDISGTAVEPNLPEWQEWRDAARDSAALLNQRLTKWKERILAVPA